MARVRGLCVESGAHLPGRSVHRTPSLTLTLTLSVTSRVTFYQAPLYTEPSP